MRLRKLRAYAQVVSVVMQLHLRQSASDSFIVFGVFVQPLVIALLGLWMLGKQGGDSGIFVVVGSGLTGLWSSLLFISGNSITGERWDGTLEPLVGAPTPMEVIIFAKNLANVLLSLGSMLGSYVLASALFGYPLRVQSPLLFAISLVLTVWAFVCFGLVIAPIFVVSPGVQQFQNGLEFPIYILCGFLFPIALLPRWTTPLSYLLPPYWAAQALHATSSGSMETSSVVLDWGLLLLFSLTDLALSAGLFRVMLRRARKDATLSME
jgi:ABC-2 type transport system permease protein